MLVNQFDSNQTEKCPKKTAFNICKYIANFSLVVGEWAALSK